MRRSNKQDRAPSIASFHPALVISALVLAFSFFGDGLRDALDPRSQE